MYYMYCWRIVEELLLITIKQNQPPTNNQQTPISWSIIIVVHHDFWTNPTEPSHISDEHQQLRWLIPVIPDRSIRCLYCNHGDHLHKLKL